MPDAHGVSRGAAGQRQVEHHDDEGERGEQREQAAPAACAARFLTRAQRDVPERRRPAVKRRAGGRAQISVRNVHLAETFIIAPSHHLPRKRNVTPGDRRQRIARRGVNARDHRREGRDARFEVVLRLVVIAVGQVIEAEIQLDAAAELPGEAEIEDGVAGGDDRGIVAIEPVVIDGAHAERAAPAVPAGQRQGGVGDEVRRAIHIDAMIAAPEESVARSWSGRRSARGGG